MRILRPLRRGAVLAPLFLLAVLLPIAPASAAVVYEIYHVPTVDGATIRVEVQRDTKFTQVPVILTYSPYNTLGETQPAADGIASRYVPKGYARAVADVLGTRGSTGCWDYGGLKEQQSGVDIVRFLAHQPWSNGSVGMTGVSYDGTTAYMVGARGTDLPELKAIVPVAGISHWYGYAYYGGVRYSGNTKVPSDEGIDTPLAFDYGFNRTFPVDDPSMAAGRVNPTCEQESLAHTQQAYSRSPDYTKFWQERDYRKDVANFRAAVMVVHGWQDYNVKQDEGLSVYESLPVDDPETLDVVEGVPFKLLWMTQSSHADGSGPGYQTLLDKFWDHTLKGVNNGVDRLVNPVTSYGRNSAGPTVWRSDVAWPPPGTSNVDLFLDRKLVSQNGVPTREEGTLLPQQPATGGTWTWTDTGSVTEEVTLRDPGNENSLGFYSLWYKSAPLASDLRIAGRAILDAYVNTTAPSEQLDPLLVEVLPDGSLNLVERGFLNLDYRNGLEHADPLPLMAWGHARMTFLPQDYTFTKGNRIGLILQSSNTAWALPGTAGVVNVANGKVNGVTDVGTRLVLPVVNPPAQLFSAP